MDDKTAVNGSGARDASANALAQKMAGTAHDVVTIAELQMQLFAVGLRELRKGVVRGLILWLIASELFLAALTTALIGAGLWLAEMAHLPTAGGLLGIALGAALLVVGLFVFGWRQIMTQRAALQRSTKELHNNLAAMRQLLSSYAGRDSVE